MDARALALGIGFAVMWSSAFTSAKIVVAHAPPLTALSVRFAISGLIAVVIARAMGQTWRLTRSQWRATAVFGLCQNALYLGLNFIAMRSIDAGLASIIASTMPLLVALPVDPNTAGLDQLVALPGARGDPCKMMVNECAKIAWNA